MKKLEAAIVIIILILSMSAIVIMKYQGMNNTENSVVIKVDNEVIKKIELGNNSTEEIIVYDFKFDNNIGYLEVNNSKVRMVEMTKDICPKGICSDTGWIDKTYQSIVCLPNKIIVAFEGNQDSTIDDTVY